MTAIKTTVNITVEFDAAEVKQGQVQEAIVKALGSRLTETKETLKPFDAEDVNKTKEESEATAPHPFAAPYGAPPAPSMPSSVEQERVSEPAEVNPPASDTEEVDSAGIPHDPRIHAANKSKRTNGTWKSARGVSDEERAKIESELKELIGSPATMSEQMQAAPAAPTSVAMAGPSVAPVASPTSEAATDAPSVPPAPPAPTTTAVAPPPPPAPAPAPQSAADSPTARFKNRISSAVMNLTVPMEEMFSALKAHGAENMLTATPDQIEAAFNTLVEKGYQL